MNQYWVVSPNKDKEENKEFIELNVYNLLVLFEILDEYKLISNHLNVFGIIGNFKNISEFEDIQATLLNFYNFVQKSNENILNKMLIDLSKVNVTNKFKKNKYEDFYNRLDNVSVGKAKLEKHDEITKLIAIRHKVLITACIYPIKLLHDDIMYYVLKICNPGSDL